jgi:hypothetical protein
LKPQPLSDAEFDRLEEILKRFGDKRAMNLEQLDGFFAALICGPNIVLPSEYLSEILGDQIINEHVFSAQPMLEEFFSLVTRQPIMMPSGDLRLWNSENSKANRIETMKGPAESGQIYSVGRRKIAKKIAKNKRCYANTLRPRSRTLLKVMKGG